MWRGCLTSLLDNKMAAVLVRTRARNAALFLTGNISICGVNLQHFHSFGMSNVLVNRLKDAGIVKPTAIQQKVYVMVFVVRLFISV